MKNKLRRLLKWLRLALLLALMGLLVFCMRLEAHRPVLSPRGALRQAEQAGLLEYGENYALFLRCADLMLALIACASEGLLCQHVISMLKAIQG